MLKRVKPILLAITAVTVLYTGSISGECHTLPESSYTQIEGTMLKRGPGVSDAAVINDIHAYQMLPFSIKNMLVANSIYIYEMSPENDSMSRPGSAALSTGTAYSINRTGATPTVTVLKPGSTDIFSDLSMAQDGPVILLHEVGHQMDYLYLGSFPATGTYFNASDQPEWQAIYAAEKNIIATYSRNAAANVYMACEGFAEATGIYFANPEWLQKNCPASYTYVGKVVSWFDSLVAQPS